MIVRFKFLNTQAILISIISALLLVVSYPPVYLWPLSIVSFILFAYFLATQELKRSERAFAFFLFTFVTRLGSLYWIPHTMMEFSDFPLPVAWALGFLAYAAMAVPSLIWGAFVFPFFHSKKFNQKNFLAIFLFWFSWDLIDIRLFGWIPAQSFAGQKYLLASAGVLGTWGWNIVFYAGVALCVHLLQKKLKKGLAYSFAIWALILSVGSVLGYFQMKKLREKYSARQPVALLQGNVGNFEKKIQHLNENPTHDVVMGIYRNLIETLALKKQSLGLGELWVFWPETAFPGFPMNDTPLSEVLSSWAKLTGSFHLVGAYEEASQTNGDKTEMLSFNIVTSYDAQGNFSGHYRKVKRMPFGEYVPGDTFYPTIYDDFKFLNHFGAGAKHVPILHPKKDGPLFLPFICFEILQESFVKEAVQEAQKNFPGRDLILVNPTNDSWFGHSAELFLHSHLAIWQAAREGLPLVRPTNTGISMIVAPWGEVLTQGKIQSDELIMSELPVTR